jgi:hypothetical protein
MRTKRFPEETTRKGAVVEQSVVAGAKPAG